MAATAAAAAGGVAGAHYEHGTGTTRIILTGTESHENPFTADGELSKKAEYIIKHSTISRSEIRISDPDLHKKGKVKEEVTRTEVTTNAAAPPVKDRENGKVEVSPKEVAVEVAAANASQPQPQQAEQVKVKGSKCKCCVVM